MKKLIIFLQLVLLTLGVIAQIPVDSLVGYWPFNGNANDESVNLNNGQVTGAVLTIDRFNLPGQAYYFDGISNKIECSSGNLNISSKVTVSAWIKTDSGDLPALVVKYDPNEDKGYVLRLRDNGNACMEGRDGNGLFISASSLTSLYDGKWHHLVGIVDFNMWSIWVDNALLSQFDSYHVQVGLQTSTALLTFGALSVDAYGNYRYFNGSIDDIRIYNRALTFDEISALYYEVPNSIIDINCESVIKIFPNPGTGIFNINFSGYSAGERYKLSVMNITGQDIFTAEVHSREYSLNLRNITDEGLYLLKVIDLDKKISYIEKLILN